MPNGPAAGIVGLAIISAAAAALWSKYSHHSATEPATRPRMTAALAAVIGFTSVSVVPMMMIDSPSAIKMNAWQRSAKWPPSMVQSRYGIGRGPGVAKPTTREQGRRRPRRAIAGSWCCRGPGRRPGQARC